MGGVGGRGGVEGRGDECDEGDGAGEFDVDLSSPADDVGGCASKCGVTIAASMAMAMHPNVGARVPGARVPRPRVRREFAAKERATLSGSFPAVPPRIVAAVSFARRNTIHASTFWQAT